MYLIERTLSFLVILTGVLSFLVSLTLLQIELKDTKILPGFDQLILPIFIASMGCLIPVTGIVLLPYLGSLAVFLVICCNISLVGTLIFCAWWGTM